MSRYYDMNGQPLELMDAMRLFEGRSNAERVAKTEHDHVTVSTVHLVIDHGYGDGPPLIFETMIFGGQHADEQWRYSTREEAEDGHHRACEIAFNVPVDDRAPAVVSESETP